MRLQRAALIALAAAAVVAGVVAAASRRETTPSAATLAHRGGPARGPRVAPIRVRGTAAKRMAVPILTYHVVSAPPLGTAYPLLWVPERDFAAQMRALAAAGYHAITLRQAFEGWFGRRGFPRHPIVISFDDGYRSQFKAAFPVLKGLGWPGVLNLALRNLVRGGINEREVEALIRAGWELDSHTITHPDLTAVGDAQLRHELVGSRRELRRRFGAPVDFFSYPAGRYDRRVVAAVMAAGYKGATTTVRGYARRSRAFTLPRLEVVGGESAAALLASLSRG